MTNKNFTPLEVKPKSEKSEVKPYKEDEFEHFLELIGEPNIKSWFIMAKALKVNPDTITSWKNHPRAKKAILEAIQENIKGMTEAGRKDWKMYREKAKMLGVDDTQNIDLTSKGKKIGEITDEQLERIIKKTIKGNGTTEGEGSGV